VDCHDDFAEFVDTMDFLVDDKLGPLLFQCPYCNKDAFKTGDEFLARSVTFLKTLPKDYQVRHRIRNKSWLTEKFPDLLREHKVALALQDQLWMPLACRDGLRLSHCRLPRNVSCWGSQRHPEKETKVWDKVIVNRLKRATQLGVDVCQQISRRGAKVYVYVNNHYSGHAPKTVADFLKLWGAK